MNTNRTGVLPSQFLRRMIIQKKILASNPIEDDQVQPSSIDLRLGSNAWRLQASFLPGEENTVKDQLKNMKMHKIDLSKGYIFEKNCVYLVRLQEALFLDEEIEAVSNTKSSIGRLDLLTRIITDYGTEFDRIPKAYKGPLYAEINPRSFSVLVQTGIRLNQIRFRRGKVTLSDDELRGVNNTIGFIENRSIIDGGVSFSVDLKGDGRNLVGYKAKAHTPLINLSKENYYPISDFWDPIYAGKGKLILDPGAFYILVSKEQVTIPPDYAAEMAPYLAVIGEFRVHYAGFFDPGFGYKTNGGEGARGVLEVRCYEAPFALKDGQNIGRLIYERMIESPDILYGLELNSNYQGQQLKLSKHFRAS